MMASPKTYNHTLDTQKMVEMKKRPLKEICDALQDIQTPLGKPWRCKIWSLKSPALVYGPDASGSYIYAHWFSGQLTLTGATELRFLKPSPKDAWRVSDKDKRRRKEAGAFYEDRINLAGVLTAYQQLFECYAGTGQAPTPQKAAEIFGRAGEMHGQLYAFQEDFKFTGQRFDMVDMQGKVLLHIEGTWPLKTLRIKDPETDEVLFRVTKRILHVLPHYDFYAGEEESQHIGSFQKKLDFTHDSFHMQYGDVEITMRSVVETIGANYIVKADGRQIGTIGENLNLSLDNLLFDNMVVEVFDDQYMLLMAALAIMSAREMSRDREDGNSLLGKMLKD
jgi:uncharacterized protein YxjI